MKKTLLMLAAIALAATANAQISKKAMSPNVKPLPTNNVVKYEKALPGSVNKHNTAATSLYYVTPKGGLWRAWDYETEKGYGHSLLNIPAWTPVEIPNMSSGKTTWTINGQELEADGDNVTAEGNYVTSYYSGGTWQYLPTVWNENKTDSFRMTDNSIYNRKQNSAYLALIECNDDVSSLKVADDHGIYDYNGTLYGNTATWGFLDSNNMFGTGKDDDYVSYAAEQIFPEPISPLYIEKIFAVGNSSSMTPIPAGKQLVATIYDVEEVTLSSGQTQKHAGQNILATFVATAEDIVAFTSDDTNTRNGKTIYEGNVIFRNYVKDELGNETEEPVVIDQEFAIVISGFEDTSINFGIYGLQLTPEEANNPEINNGYLYFADADGNGPYYATFNGSIVADIGIVGMYDHLEFESGLDAVRLSDDGQSCAIDGYPSGVNLGGGVEINGALAYTAAPWYDAEGNENYFIEDQPDWITEVVVDDTYFENYGFYVVTFKGEPLSSGGRQAHLKIVGRGVDATVTVLQGDAVNAIESVESTNQSDNNAMYNLAGQRVNSNYKGIVIQNGKKFINK